MPRMGAHAYVARSLTKVEFGTKTPDGEPLQSVELTAEQAIYWGRELQREGLILRDAPAPKDPRP